MMVNKETIDYIIGKSIETIKCRKPSYSLISLSNQIKSVLNKFARETRTLPYERGLLLDDKGNILIDTTDNSPQGVVIGQIGYLENKIVEEYCKDIIEEFNEEGNALAHNTDATYEDFDDFDKRYEQAIFDRLNNIENVQVHIEHNHPGAYGYKNEDGNEVNVPLDYGVFTCLSEGDIRTIRVGVTVWTGGSDIYVPNLVKSITAECSNGSRMTLVNHNPIGEKMDFDKFDTANNHLREVWKDYLNKSREDGQAYVNTFTKKYEGYKGDDLQEVMNKDMNDYLKKKSKEEFPKMLQGVIDEFSEANCELRIDWL